MDEQTQEPKLAMHSKTIQFAAIKPILLAAAVVLLGEVTEQLGLQIDHEAIQLTAETLVASLPFLVAEVWLRFKTFEPITLKVQRIEVSRG